MALSAQQNQEGQLQEFLDILKRRFWQVLLPAGFATAIGVAIANFLPKQYEVMTDVALRPPDLPLGNSGMSQILNDLGIAPREITNAQRIRDVIEKLEWQDFSTLTRDEQILYIRRVIDDLQVNMPAGGKNNAGARMIRMVYRDADPQRAERFLNNLRDDYLEDVLERVRVQAKAMEDNLNRMMNSKKQVYEDAESQRADLAKLTAISGVQAPAGRGLPQTESPIQMRLSMATDELDDVERNLDAKKAQLEVWREQFAAEPPSIEKPPAVTEESVDLEIAEIDDQIEEKREQQSGLRTVHSRYQKLETEIALLIERKTRILEENEPERAEIEWVPNPERDQLEDKIQIAEAEIAGLTSEQETLSAEVDELKGRSIELEDVFRELTILETQVEQAKIDFQAADALYREQANTTQMLESRDANPFTVLENAQASNTPVSPQIPTIITLSVLLGLGLGLASAFAAEFMRGGYRSSSEVTRSMPVPVLAAINGIVTRQEARRNAARRVVVGISSVLLIGAILWVTWAYKNKPRLLGPTFTQMIDDLREQFR